MNENVIEIKYEQTGETISVDEMGMREMQRKAYASRNEQYLLIKAPPASGKSRAMMYIALDKLKNQGIKRVVIAVPEKTIGGSFKSTNLMKGGFFANWTVSTYFNLCDTHDEHDKVGRFKEFFTQENCRILVCTHATLQNGMKEIEDMQMNECLLGLDEFHHVSASEDSGLGDIVRRLMTYTTAHIVAMTGSYFRGDRAPVLRPEDEARFKIVTYNYYEQLNGYKYLKSLGLGYHFYQGKYLDAIKDVLDTTKKTLIHIPSVNSRASTGLGKYTEVEEIIKMIGKAGQKDYSTGITPVTTEDGRTLKVIDLVETDERDIPQNYLQHLEKRDDVDIIIALGTAKEGFDWIWCEHCLTIGVRGSLTEVVQIIGRCTRDCKGKEHAQFTNLIAAPDAKQDDVTVAVNDMLKAVTASLLMEQVMAPSWKFRTLAEEGSDGKEDDHVLVVEGLKPLSSEKARQICAEQLDDLKATILQNDEVIREPSAEIVTEALIPKIIKDRYPDLSDEEVEEVRERVILDTVIKGTEITIDSDGNRLIKLANRFINIDDLKISLIDTINPFQRAYEVMSKQLTAPVFKVIQDTIAEQRSGLTKEEAILLCKGALKQYVASHNGNLPSKDDPNPDIRRLFEAYNIIRNEKIRYMLHLESEKKEDKE